MKTRVSMAFVIVLTVAACGSGAAEETTTTLAPTSTIAATTTTSTTATTTTTIATTAPLTGLAGPEAANQILIVKVSNAPKARPQVGLEATDMVIEGTANSGSKIWNFTACSDPSPCTASPSSCVRGSQRG